MNLPRLTQLLVEQVRQLVLAAHEIVPQARVASRKPAAIGYILFTAHRAQIVTGILLVFLVFLAPPAVDFVTSTVFPGETSKAVFGLIKTQHENPLKGIADVAIMTILWITSTAVALLLLWFHIPRGLVRANNHARSLLDSGDSLGDLAGSRSLYRRALPFATDPGLEHALRSRMGEEGSYCTARLSPGMGRDDEETTDGDTLVSTLEAASHGEIRRSQTNLGGRYSLGLELGKGAMGIVFRAWDEVLDRTVAVKQLSVLLSGDDEYADRFRREAKTLARLSHPNVVQVYDLIEHGSRLWMILEFVDGGDLASYLEDNGPLSIGEAANIVIPVAEGLAFAHGHGIVHRDLKPANVLLTSKRIPKISDFGIAKLSQASELTQLGSVLGSPRYMSPEQCSGGSVDSRTDIYALGITLYELLSGKVPFEGDTSGVLARHIIEQPVPLSEIAENIPPEMEDLVSRMLSKNPDERPADMTEVLDLLAAFVDESSSPKRSQCSHNVV